MPEFTIPVDACYSSLGHEPICDVCQKPIILGDRVTQSFTGMVKQIEYQHESVEVERELVVEETQYRLIHVRCNN